MNRLFAISAGAGGATAALIVIIALLLTGHPKVPIIPGLPTPPPTNNTKPTPPPVTPVTQPNPPSSGPFYFDLSQKNQTTVPINYTIFTPKIVLPSSSNVPSTPVVGHHGSNVTTIILHGGGGGGGGGPSITIVKNTLTASPDVIDLGGNTTLTQEFLTSPATTDTMLQIMVTLPNQDICGAKGLPASLGSAGKLSIVFPDDFTLISGKSGDKCDTSQAGTYNAAGQILYAGAVAPSSGAFNTKFFVVPETPLGSIALLVSSLGAVAAFVFVKQMRAARSLRDLEPKPMSSYCVKCRQHRLMKSPKAATMKNGRAGISGACDTCGSKMFRFGSIPKDLA